MKFPAASSTLFLLLAVSSTEGFALPPPAAGATGGSSAFVVTRYSSSSSSSSVVTGTATALHGVKRGRLASNVSPEGLTTPTGGKKKKKKSKVAKKLEKKGAAAPSDPSASKPAPKGISSSLADWAASVGDDDDAAASSAASVTAEAEVEETSSASSFARFEPEEEQPVQPKKKGGCKKGGGGGKKDRRSRQAERLSVENARRSKIGSALSDLRALFDPPEDDDGKKPSPRTNFDVQTDVLNNLRVLASNPPEGGPRPIIQGKEASEYRMVWAGSDSAVCALCSGLHNVPLARLEEVFLNLGRGGTVEVLEVIRVLGPFPNVRNTLKGSVQLDKKRGGGRGLAGGGDDGNKVDRLQIAYDSMIDGTGKEIPAPQGSKDGIRRVELDVMYADEDAVVCVVPDDEEEGDEKDPLTGDGSRVLLFFRERDLDGQLNRLRAA